MRDMPLCAPFFLLKSKTAKRTYHGIEPARDIVDHGKILPCPLLGAAAATATPVATLHSVALMHMGRKPYTEAGKERRRTRTMEALLPPHVLHGDDDCNQEPTSR